MQFSVRIWSVEFGVWSLATMIWCEIFEFYFGQAFFLVAVSFFNGTVTELI
jgi:hypothetical protein